MGSPKFSLIQNEDADKKISMRKVSSTCVPDFKGFTFTAPKPSQELHRRVSSSALKQDFVEQLKNQ